MVQQRPISLPGRRICTSFVFAALLAVLTSTAWAGAVTAGSDDPAPASRLPVDRGSAAPAHRPTTSSTVIKSPAAQSRRCGDGHASTPRS
jgi:hypothetical protein